MAKREHRQEISVQGGPYDGRRVLLPGATLCFSVAGCEPGRYLNGKWYTEKHLREAREKAALEVGSPRW